jgi:hypothetical protein
VFINEKRGLWIEEIKIQIVMDADDIVPLATHPKTLQKMSSI